MKKNPRKSAARRHAEAEIFSFGGLEMRYGPPTLIVYAEHYLSAARSIKPPETAPGFSLVRAFLVCRALELALKAFLSLKGRSLVQLSGGPYGHDLKSLIEQAEKLDLHSVVKLEDRQRAEIVRASNYYAAKVFEYPALIEAVRAYPDMPITDVLIGVVETLVGALREPCLQAV